MSAMRWSVDQLNPAMRAQAAEKIREAGSRARTGAKIEGDASSELLKDPPTHSPMTKYRNHRVHYNGIRFDSLKELEVWREHELLQKAGEITDLRHQVRFTLEHNGTQICDYVADITYCVNGALVVKDVKGMKKGAAYEKFRLKAKLMKALLGIDVIEV